MPDGRVKFIDERWEIFRDEQGRPFRVAGTCLDVTDRMRSEEEARAIHQKLIYHVENSPLAVVEWDSSLHVQRWSRRAEELFGWRADEVMGLSPSDWPFVHPDDQTAVSKIVAELLQDGQRHNLSINRNHTKDGRTIYCEWYNSALVGLGGNLLSILSLVSDITNRTQAEESLLQSERQLRALSARLESLREEERTHISREIHDKLGQMLTAVKMDLRWMEHCLDEFGEDRRLNPILDKLVATSELIDATVDTVQRIATELRSDVLDKLGLSAALEHEAAQFEERTGIACAVVAPGNLPLLQPEISIAFYRIFQECLTNIIRHANASAVQIEFLAADVFRLEVRDNGRGIGMDDLRNLNSLGLLGMRERARLLGGEVSISRQSGGGTTVTVLIPKNTGHEGSV
jgi:PAS domain S-box-containing protein